ncbi:MAG TPA: serine/threonine-protein kinase, partial [Polyangiales bacterium]|nr:serine/threonine-protein kinase [Polyangiales bacterium]
MDHGPQRPSLTDSGEWLEGGRYRIDGLLGRGGVGAVYRAYDRVKATTVALKRFALGAAIDGSGEAPSQASEPSVARKERVKRAQMLALFQREYHTLAQLAHPRIIQVYDYGVDQLGAYYTMELLEGRDLSQAGPLSWLRVCEVLRDVASALTLLHSRCLLHRDISPRNVHCGEQGPAKLIDFGAMTPMGVSQLVMGTPQFVAPEVLQRQSLDARADLYSLGALGYYLLTGRPPYSVRTFDELRDAYRTQPRPPSAWVEGIPAQLDQLVMRLISLDRAARPSSAVDLVERLTALGGLQTDPRLAIASSYLTAPTIVGRGKELAAIRRRTLRTLRGSGASVLVSSPSGGGLTRFLDACALEGKLAGAVVLRAAASAPVDVGHVTRALLLQLHAALTPAERSQLELPANLRDHSLPSAIGTRASHPPSLPPAPLLENDGALSRALHEHVARVAATRPILVLIDDFHAADPDSAADLVSLAATVADRRLVVVAAYDQDAASQVESALRVLRETSRCLSLAALTTAETAALLGSVFGAVPHVAVLADRLHSLSAGRPRLCMELAQHLVDQGVIRYETGGFVLPASLAQGDLPQSLDAVLLARCARLSEHARTLGAAIALCAGAPLSVEHLLMIAGQPDRRLGESALGELIASQIATVHDDQVQLRQQAFGRALAEGLPDAEQRLVRGRIAELWANEPRLRMYAAEQFFFAGDSARAVDVLLQAVQESRTSTFWFPNLVELITRGLTACEQLGRPARHAFLLRRTRMQHAIDYLEPAMGETLLAFAQELYRASGLAHWHEHPDLTDPVQRVSAALSAANELYERTPEMQRICSVEQAVTELGGSLSGLAAYACSTFDLALLERVPSMAPYALLSPAIELTESVVAALRDLRGSRHEHYVVGLRRVLARLEQPDLAGLSRDRHRMVRLGVSYAVALTGAAMGDPRAFTCADELETVPTLRNAAWRVRQIAHLHLGDLEQAESCRRQVEVLLIQQASRQARAGATLETEFLCYARMDDLINLRRLLPELRAMAADHPGWVPLSLLGEAELERIRGRHQQALAISERVLELALPGRHMMWSAAIGLKMRLLVELGRAAEAKAIGLECSAFCVEREMGGVVGRNVDWPLALAEIALGEHEAAIARVDHMMQHSVAEGVGGMYAGMVYELRARLALLVGDEAGFTRYYEHCASYFGSTSDSPFALNLARLRADARKAGVDDGGAEGPSPSLVLARAVARRLRRELTDCADVRERAERALALVLETTGAPGGHLYSLQHGKVVRVASAGASPPQDALTDAIARYMTRFDQVNEDHTAVVSAENDFEHEGAALLTVEGSGYRLFPLSNPMAVER